MTEPLSFWRRVAIAALNRLLAFTQTLPEDATVNPVTWRHKRQR